MICGFNNTKGRSICYSGVLKIPETIDTHNSPDMLALITKNGEFRFKLLDIDMIQFDSKDISDYVVYVKGMTFNVICDEKSNNKITANKLYNLWQKRLLIESLKYENFNERFKIAVNLLRKITQNKDPSDNEEKDNEKQETENL